MARQIKKKKQHTISQCYLKSWMDSSGCLWLHDLKKEQTHKHNKTANILQASYYYEENSLKPDYRVENILQDIENRFCPILKKLHGIFQKYLVYSHALETELENYMSKDVQQIIKEFTNYQYLRVPGAIKQKKYELQTTSLPEEQKKYALNPGRFVDSGFTYTKRNFQSLKMLIHISFGELFITSDRPCFDVKDSDFSPILGEEVGVSSSVILYIPLSPRFSLLLYPSNYSSYSSLTPEVIFKEASQCVVKNQNKLVIQIADRYVIAQKEEDYIYKIASKRKKAFPPFLEMI